MADGVSFTVAANATPPGGTIAATDDLGANGHAGIAKLAVSADGDATRVPADAVNGLTVNDVILAARVPDELGTWGYDAGVSGTEVLAGGKRVIGIAAIATAAGASVTINGGDSIPVPEDIGFELAPRANLVDPTIVFTGTASYIVEHLT